MAEQGLRVEASQVLITTGSQQGLDLVGKVLIDAGSRIAVEAQVDPAVAEAVHSVRDRFGAHGLRDLIALAGYELELAEQALASLRAEVVDAPPSAEDDAFDVPLASEPGDRDLDLDEGRT